jgi:hypothetical protein
VKMAKNQLLTLSKFLTCLFYAAGQPVMISKKRNLQYGRGMKKWVYAPGDRLKKWV